MGEMLLHEFWQLNSTAAYLLSPSTDCIFLKLQLLEARDLKKSKLSFNSEKSVVKN